MKVIVANQKGRTRPMIFVVPDTVDVGLVRSTYTKINKVFDLIEINSDELNVCGSAADVTDVLKEEAAFAAKGG